MAKMPNRKMKFKLNIVVLGLLALAFLVLAIRTIFIACFAEYEGVKYGVKARNRQMSANVIRANRGTIYDRNMVPFAQSATVFIVTISPNQFKSDEQKEQTFKDLCFMLEIDDEEEIEKIHKRFKSKRKYEIIKKNVEKPKRDELLKYIKKHKLYNIVNIEEDTKRYYPLKTLASHTIGFVGADNQGLLGLELFYDKILSGENGKLLRVQDARGGPMPYEFENLYPAKNGNSIVTSLDSVVQRVCSESLVELHKWHRPNNRCLAIVMDVKTGEIIAMATNPEFDLNNPFDIPDDSILPGAKDMSDKDKRAYNWKNKVVSENYEPGSVFKVVTGSAALEEKTASLDSTYSCSGVVNVQGEKMHCWKHEGHGSQDFTRAFVNSCNPAFVSIGQSLGAQKFFKYLELFGITKRTGIDLPGETDPIFHKEKDLIASAVSLASESFGQSVSITPLQMLNAFCAVVNGGYLNRPHILKQILDNKGNIIKTITKKPFHQVLSKETSAMMRKILSEVVKGPMGTGTNSSVPGYIIGGKTGTAQDLEKKRRTGEEVHIGSFAGVLTADDPRYAIFVLTAEPTGIKYYGSDVASPTFNRITTKIAPYFGIPKKLDKEKYERLFNKVDSCEGMPVPEAKKLLEKSNFKNVKVLGDEDENIVAQLPEAGIDVSKDSLIYLYTDEDSLKENTVSVPNLSSLSPAEAKERLKSVGLNMSCENTSIIQSSKGSAIDQFPEKETKVAKGSVVEVTFIMNDGTGWF